MNCRTLILVFAVCLSLPGRFAAADDRQSRLIDSVKVDAQTEVVIQAALSYLAKRQEANGSWTGERSTEQRHPIAITSYALMAMLATGNLPDEGRYGQHVRRATDFLLNSVHDGGFIGNENGGQYMYEHGISTIVLAELYGQTGDNSIRPRLEQLVKVIVSSQNERGGWRYRPVAEEADISVTVLQVVALRAAKNSGLDVPQRTIDNAVRYVRDCYNKDKGGFAYQPGGDAGFARTAAAIYSLQVCGHYDDPRVKTGSEYLRQNFEPGGKWFTYGNFYAAPAHYMIGGQAWRDWYERVNRVLLENVQREDDGTAYWDIKMDRGGLVGPVFNTAVYTVVLAMPYHYLPLYQR